MKLENIMAHFFKQMKTPVLFALAALSAGSLALGCAAHVETGGSSDKDPNGTAEGTTDDSDAVNRRDECQKEGEGRDCGTPVTVGNNQTIYGTQLCERDDDGVLRWGECVGPNTPLVLSFDRSPVAFAESATSASFDLTGTTTSITTDWPTAKTPWLALDRDGNGQIDSGSELFGSATVLNHGARATNGFIALRELDDNGDGQITDADAAWSKLLLWTDRDGDRVSTTRELEAVSSYKLVAIELGYTTARAVCDARGNCEVERATFRYVDSAGAERTGDVIDVHLKAQ